jgi:hypothetical protein
LPDRKKPIETYAVVRWVVSVENPGMMQPGMGVQFDDLGPKDFREVQELIEGWVAQ